MSGIENMQDISMSEMLRQALDYAARGWPVLPCDPAAGPRCKGPLVARDHDEAGLPIPRTGGLYKATKDEHQLRSWWLDWPNAMIGVRTGEASGVFVIDVDAQKAPGQPDGVAAWATLVKQHGGIPTTRVHRTPSGGMHIFFRWRADRPVTNRRGRLPPGIDVRGDGGYIMMPPSRLGDGGRYEIVEPTGDIDIADAPDWLYALLEAPPKHQLNGRVPAMAGANRSGAAIRLAISPQYAAAALEGEFQAVARAEPGTRNHTLNCAAFKLGSFVPRGVLTPAQISDRLVEAAALCGLTEENGVEAVLATIDSGLSAGIKSPRVMPDQKSKSDRPVSRSAGGRQGGSRSPHGGQQGDTPAITQDGVAQLFSARYEGELLFCHDTGTWFRWAGTHWRKDTTDHVFQVIREVAREATEVSSSKVQKEARKVTFVSGVERFARGDPAFAVTTDAWDRDPSLLGTPGGTVDLRTGRLRPADPGDRITRLTAVAPAETVDCPQWLNFLNQATGGDKELIRSLRQWCGYALTGDISEHAFVFIYGPGGNGKSVFLNTLTGILADYAATAPMDTFTASNAGRHPTDLAMLRGARLVTASETEEGNSWAESRLKHITGGDPISARFMHQNFFTYMPQFKLMIIGNHKPPLRNIDEAIKRRLNIVPFTHKPAAPDRDLEAKLKREWPAILRWMIEGCLDWRASGLVPCNRIVTETTSYFDDQDLLGQWLEEACDAELGNRYKSDTVADLFQSWSAYATAAGEKAGSIKTFSEALQRKGFERYKGAKGVRMFRGLYRRFNGFGDG
jgi:putative DNA primase/helicase